MPENKDSQGQTIYDEAGNYGTCDICGRTLNDNVDQGPICYGCTEGIQAEDEMRWVKAKCKYCNRELEAHEDDMAEVMADHEADCAQYAAMEYRAEMSSSDDRSFEE